MILRLAGMIISPVSALTTSSGIFSFSKMFERAWVSSSFISACFLMNLSSTPLACRLASPGASLMKSFLIAPPVVFTSITIPADPEETTSELSFTSAAFSPKMARRRRSSGANSVSLFGVILPTKMSPAFTSAPIRTTPSGPRFFKASSPTFGISRVISSGPSFVSRAEISNSSMWILV